MREDYLHYLWKFQKFGSQVMKTVDGHVVQVITPGHHNELSGPDFFNSRLVIGNQEWAGNVEIHLRSSDWYMHGHETDAAYDNVILHVVWNHDVEIFRRDNSPLPVLELQGLVSPESHSAYENLCGEGTLKWINCEEDFPDVDDFILNNWLERLYVERLEARAALIGNLLTKTAGDWEAVLFLMLAKNLGLNINGEAFLSIAASIPFSVIRKTRGNLFQLEALFMGQAGLLHKNLEDPYYTGLQEEYSYLKHRFKLACSGVLPVQYFRLRPDNFPEIRLAQLAALYHKHASLFSSLQKCDNIEQLKVLFDVEVSEFWSTHYTFSRSHNFRKKQLSKKFLDLVIINTVVPLRFSFQKSLGKDAFDELVPLLKAVAPEGNEIISKFRALRPAVAQGAIQSQALLQLKKEYCDKKACLKCAVGLSILQQQPQF